MNFALSPLSSSDDVAQDSADPGSALSYYGARALSAVFHDLLASHLSSLQGDIDYYARMLPPRADVLELGCGSGRVAVALAAAGFHVTGVDLAPTMISLTNAKRRRLPPSRAGRVRFSIGDMTRLSLARRFQAVLVPFYAFNHLAGPAQRQQALNVIADHLAPGARAYIHVLSAQTLQHERDLLEQEGWTVPFNNGAFRLHCRPVKRTLDAPARSVTQDIEYLVSDADGAPVRRSHEACTYHWFSDAEMRSAAAKAGLRLMSSRAHFGHMEAGAHETLYRLSA